MECSKIKEVIPKYFNHTASEEEIKTVEEHLCVCHDCRTALGELMDKTTDSEQPADKGNLDQEMQIIPGNMPETPLGEEVKTTTSENLESKSEDIEYFPGNGLEEGKDSEKNTAQGETSQADENLNQESPKMELPDEKKDISSEQPHQEQQESVQEAKEPVLDANDEIKPVPKEEPVQIPKDNLELVSEDKEIISSEEEKEQSSVPLGNDEEVSSSVASDESLKTPDAVESTQKDKPEKEETKHESGLEALPPEGAQEDSYTSLENAKKQLQEKSTSKVSGAGKVAGSVEYLFLVIGMAVLGFLIYLVVKG